MQKSPTLKLLVRFVGIWICSCWNSAKRGATCANPTNSHLFHVIEQLQLMYATHKCLFCFRACIQVKMSHKSQQAKWKKKKKSQFTNILMPGGGVSDPVHLVSNYQNDPIQLAVPRQLNASGWQQERPCFIKERRAETDGGRGEKYKQQQGSNRSLQRLLSLWQHSLKSSTPRRCLSPSLVSRVRQQVWLRSEWHMWRKAQLTTVVSLSRLPLSYPVGFKRTHSKSDLLLVSFTSLQRVFSKK